MNRARFPLWLILLVACWERPHPPPLSLEATPAGPNTRLVLLVSPGLELNARLAPALELAGGTVVRFHAERLTPDSAYFAEPPIALLPGHEPVHGTLRASVCDNGATVCRTVVVRL